MASVEKGKSFYARNSSGLTREVSVTDILIYNTFNVGLNFLLFLVFEWVAYPGASLFWAVIICVVGSSFMSLAYSLFATVFPRTGGEYVYGTRTFGGLVGFMMSWNIAVWILWFMGVVASQISYSTIAPFMTSIGLLTGNKGLVSSAQSLNSPIVIYAIGEVAIIFFALLLISGAKKYFTFQKILFIFGLGGYIVGAIVLWTANQADFITRFNSYMTSYSNTTDAYHSIIQTATSNGLTLNPPFSVLETLHFTIWAFLGLGFVAFSAAFSGEVKNVRRSQPIGMIGSLLICAVIFLLWGYGGIHAFGNDFLQSATYLSQNDPSKLIFPTTPLLNSFVTILTSNVFISGFISTGVFAMGFIAPGLGLLFASRVVLSWSIDRMIPDRFAHVSSRFHTPTYILILLAGLGSFFTLLYVFEGSVPFLVSLEEWGIFGECWTFFAVGVAATVFPFVAKRFYKGSPIEGLKVAGVPLITIVGIGTMIYLGTMIYWFMTDPVVGTNTPTAWATVAVVPIVGAIFYLVARTLRKRQGVDLSLAYREIPIE